MANKLQRYIYRKGGWFWFRGWSHRFAKRDAGYRYSGIRWKWLVKGLYWITGCRFCYYKGLLGSPQVPAEQSPERTVNNDNAQIQNQ